MAWNGSGVFSRTNGVNTGSEVWQDDRNDGTKIRADYHDTHDQDLADGINACLNKDGENAPTADLGWDSVTISVGNATAGAHALNRDTADARYIKVTGTSAVTLRAETSTGVSGPSLTLFRKSSTPTTGDVLGVIPFRGMTTAGVSAEYGAFVGKIVEATATSATGALVARVLVNGTSVEAVTIEDGVYLNGATGGAQGDGTLNASALYINGTSVVAPGTDFDHSGAVFENYKTRVTVRSGTSYTFVTSDSGKVVQFNAATSVSATLPADMVAGVQMLIRQIGAGQVKLSVESGATLGNINSDTKLAGQYAEAALGVATRTTADAVWVLSGATTS